MVELHSCAQRSLQPTLVATCEPISTATTAKITTYYKRNCWTLKFITDNTCIHVNCTD